MKIDLEDLRTSLKRKVRDNYFINSSKCIRSIRYLLCFDGDNVKTTYFSCRYYYRLGLYEESINLLKKGLPKVKQNTELILKFHLLLGKCYESIGNYDEAEYHYDEVIMSRRRIFQVFKKVTSIQYVLISKAYFRKAKLLLKSEFNIDVDAKTVTQVICSQQQTDYFYFVNELILKSIRYFTSSQRKKISQNIQDDLEIIGQNQFFLRLSY